MPELNQPIVRVHRILTVEEKQSEELSKDDSSTFSPTKSAIVTEVEDNVCPYDEICKQLEAANDDGSEIFEQTYFKIKLQNNRL